MTSGARNVVTGQYIKEAIAEARQRQTDAMRAKLNELRSVMDDDALFIAWQRVNLRPDAAYNIKVAQAKIDEILTALVELDDDEPAIDPAAIAEIDERDERNAKDAAALRDALGPENITKAQAAALTWEANLRD